MTGEREGNQCGVSVPLVRGLSSNVYTTLIGALLLHSVNFSGADLGTNCDGIGRADVFFPCPLRSFVNGI